MMSQIGIWFGFGLQAAVKLVHGGRYGAPEVDAEKVILEAVGGAIVLTLVSALFDQLAYFCESYFCDIPVLRVWEACDLREKFFVPVFITFVLGSFYMTSGFLAPLVSIELGN